MQDTVEMQPEPNKDERTWGMLCHLSAFAGFIIPFGGIIAPLIIWLIKKDEMPFVNDQGKEAINFQITVFIAALICFVLMFVGIGFLLLFALAIYAIVMIIIATIKANEGSYYRYPHALRLIK
ncbi:putative Tic20 family protein [Methylohalomonas lacus]|uniref:Tic20 family protein n=1 Tax=Methylohalomonas lacus TaxID=398773 RepID=A0AAE3HJE7_9GAMM|nr:DUF4870 domain-containing protein [Methylohalomonas lacus]MCS3902114.1 putative Tic20 family protein [Methylohalomonas lacus]